jgi:hypothetical protein
MVATSMVFVQLAERRLPSSIFNYIDGAADDAVIHRRNSASFDRCHLISDFCGRRDVRHVGDRARSAVTIFIRWRRLGEGSVERASPLSALQGR